MIPVYQTGMNCFQACIASILELTLEEVPDFVNKYDSFIVKTGEWLGERGYMLYYITLATSNNPIHMSDGSQYYIQGGTYKGIGHCIVASGNDFAHDPRTKTDEIILDP